MSDIFNQLLAETDNEYAGIVDDGEIGRAHV